MENQDIEAIFLSIGLGERVNALRWLQAESQAELDALLPSVLDRAFKGGM